MTNEELLEEAKRRYPIGCRYRNLNSIGEPSIPNMAIKNLPVINKDSTFSFSKDKSADGKNPILVSCKGLTYGWVYSNGKWAEIISLPENKEVIPEYVECIGLKEDKAKGWSNYFTIGRVYKVNSTANMWIHIVGDDNDEWACDHSQFKSSTKEAFDAQNKPKQPLKQAVHCTSQEEWDFVTEKLGNDGRNWFEHPDWGNNKSFCISFEGKNQSQTLDFYIRAGYQILSFQEWCYLNGYKMDSRVKFEAGKWHKGQDNSYRKCSTNGYMCKYSEMILNGIWMSSSGDAYWFPNLVTDLSEIQQYLPKNHPDKIKPKTEFVIGKWYKIRHDDFIKVSEVSNQIDFMIINFSERIKFGKFAYESNYIASVNLERYALENPLDVSEIQQYLPDGHPDKIKVECEIKPSDFEDHSWNTVLEFRGGSDTILSHHNYVRNTLINESATRMCGVLSVEAKDLDWRDLIPESYCKKENPMILSIYDEELSMVSVIKTNTIKQLLNYE